MISPVDAFCGASFPRCNLQAESSTDTDVDCTDTDIGEWLYILYGHGVDGV